MQNIPPPKCPKNNGPVLNIVIALCFARLTVHGPFRNVGPGTRSRLEDTSSQRDQLNVAGPSTSNAADRADDNSGSIDLFPLSRASEESIGVDKYLADFPSSLDFSPDMADIQNNLPNAPSASQVAAGGGASTMDTDAQMEGGAGGSGANSVGGGLASGAMATILPNPRLKSGHLTFQKVWYKYTYGLANSRIVVPCGKVIR